MGEFGRRTIPYCRPISMGQRAAKHNMQAGVRLYHQRHHAQAIHKWRQALHRLTSVLSINFNILTFS
ncbi:hypothetical protein NECAME_12133 [Necator americanus]|uniref:Rapsyn myristoylation/linker region N-terminal domain-containing protein n=1 Tax=Necator americanus TaxID=51031 RepID=W2T3K3_NECAM|nr:hypothetical protein NECAME_12133 [Necator americanus]ETN75791.1 hypothetical protein NECAME_12133 [Necator americanus]